MPISSDDAALDLNIGACARVARKTHDDIHNAMFTGALPCHRDHDGRRVVKLWPTCSRGCERKAPSNSNSSGIFSMNPPSPYAVGAAGLLTMRETRELFHFPERDL